MLLVEHYGIIILLVFAGYRVYTTKIGGSLLSDYLKMNDFLPEGKKIKRVLSGSEILLAYELSKYTRLMLDREFLLGVPVERDLMKSAEYSFAVSNGLDLGFTVDTSRLTAHHATQRLFFLGTVENVNLLKDTPEEVIYDFNHDPTRNRVMHGDSRSAAYVSLMAYLMVRAYQRGEPMPKIIYGTERYSQKEREYVDICILQGYGNKIAEGMFEIHSNSAFGYQPEWEAFVIYNRQLGNMDREYTPEEKYKYLSANFQPGDVVLRYMRRNIKEGESIFQLESCFPAVIQSFDKNELKLVYYPFIQTKLTRTAELQALEADLQDDYGTSIINEDDYVRFQESQETVSLHELGVDIKTYREQLFICAFHDSMAEDGTHQYMRTPRGTDRVYMTTLETVYALLEDREIKYNKERFLSQYFKRTTPLYEEYRQEMEEYRRLQKAAAANGDAVL